MPTKDLIDVLLPAYEPCTNFGTCREAQWNPTRGQIPRGFLGATGKPEDVKVVMVFAQPGHPHDDELYDPNACAIDTMRAGMAHVYKSYKERTDLFHSNARWFMSQLYPNLTFDEQLQYIWLTEGRLCSVNEEVGATTDRSCANHFLIKQFKLLPNAVVVAFGGKAKHYLKGLGIDFVGAYSLAPPGANHRPARPSWETALDVIKEQSV